MKVVSYLDFCRKELAVDRMFRASLSFVAPVQNHLFKLITEVKKIVYVAFLKEKGQLLEIHLLEKTARHQNLVC